MSKTNEIIEKLAKPGTYFYCDVNEKSGKAKYLLLELQGESGHLNAGGQMIITSEQFRNAKRTTIPPFIAHRIEEHPEMSREGFVADPGDDEPSHFFSFRRLSAAPSKSTDVAG